MKNRLFRKTLTAVFSVVILLFCRTVYGGVIVENIDPDDDGSQYAYGENVGWLNAEPNAGPGVEVTDSALIGYIWAENIGWINLSPASYGGVVNDGIGNLSGNAWAENVGWINFAPTGGGVTIDADGNFDGWAWGENIGWIHFKNLSVPYKVQTAWAPPQAICGDLDGDGDVDLDDRNILFAAFRSTEGSANFVSAADYDGDGVISFADYRLWYACYIDYL